MSTGTTTLTDRKTSAWLWPALFSLVAFAANSVFCRLALKDGAIDPVSFTVVRLASGALFLLLLIRLRSPVHTMGGSWWGGLALFLYAFLFSAAYLQLGAGTGALLLFGAVQITMFGFAWYRGEHITVRMLLGMLIAFAGLLVLLLPGVSAPPLASALLMALSGVAWGYIRYWAKARPGRWPTLPAILPAACRAWCCCYRCCCWGPARTSRHLACCMPWVPVCWLLAQAMPFGMAWSGRSVRNRRRPCSSACR